MTDILLTKDAPHGYIYKSTTNVPDVPAKVKYIDEHFAILETTDGGPQLARLPSGKIEGNQYWHLCDAPPPKTKMADVVWLTAAIGNGFYSFLESEEGICRDRCVDEGVPSYIRCERKDGALTVTVIDLDHPSTRSPRA